MLVQNPDGEVYTVKAAKFEKTYEKVGEGVYKAKVVEKPFVTTTKNICFKASWGEVQYSPIGSKLCVEDKNSIYSVTNMAFEKTYKEIENSSSNEEENDL